MHKLKVLDLCCGAGGASEGYYRAGFDVVGIDHVKQPHYKFEFILADALPYLINNWLRIEAEFDLITGGPPCQKYSDLTPDAYKAGHSDMLEHVLAFLRTKNKPYIIENVSGARRHMINPVMLCGSMFGLPIWRHRYFENNLDIFASPACCNHELIPILVSGVTRRTQTPKVVVSGRSSFGWREGIQRRKENTAEEKRQAMGINWMTEKEVTQAIPPAFTHWLGQQAINYLAAQAA
jgi:DNA (cytosine-5)-methyltransferase 1